MTLREIKQAVALATAFALLAAAWRYTGVVSSGDRALDRALAPASPLTAAQRLSALETRFRAIEESERTAPRDRWDADDVIRLVGPDPERLFEWVRDDTFWVPYRGVLRGVAGVLMDRQGNSLERAALLATLLQKAGRTVRLAHGTLTRDVAVQMLPALVAARRASMTGPQDQSAEQIDADLQEIANRYLPDAQPDGRKVQSEAAAAAIGAVHARVRGQSDRLLAAVARPDPRAEWTKRLEDAIGSLRDHWWVQQAEGTAWRDLDPAGAVHQPGGAPVIPFETFDGVVPPSAQYQEIAIRVVGEQWSRGTLTERTAFEHIVRPSDQIGRPIVLQFWPGDWPADILLATDDRPRTFVAAALDQRRWAAALVVGGELAAHAMLENSGAVAQPSTNPLRGLGGAMGGMFAQPAPAEPARSDELTAVWIEYDIRVPGESSRRIRRAIFDVLGAAKRAAPPAALKLTDDERLLRHLSLMMRTEIAAVPCDLSPEFVAHLTAQSLLGNKALLRSLVSDVPDAGNPAAWPMPSDAAPPVSSLYPLAVARTDWSQLHGATFRATPAILTRHRFPASSGGTLVMKDAVDIVANETGVDLAAPDGFATRLEQGVFDTNVEAFLQPGIVSGNTADAYGDSGEWTTLTSARRDAVDALKLPEDARRSILRDVESGFIVVAPATAPASGGGWWRIDAATGDALGVAHNGWGAAMSERALLTTLLTFANSFAFEFAFCQALPQMMNEMRSMGVDIYHVLGNPAWLPTPAAPEDSRKLFMDNLRGCLIGAMIGGLLSTLGILLMLRSARGAEAGLPIKAPPLPKEIPAPPRPVTRKLPPPKTEPDLPFKPTDPVPNKPAAPPGPRRYPTEPEVTNAKDAADKARDRSRDAFRDFVDYRTRYSPGDGMYKQPHPEWSPELDEALANEMWTAQFDAERAENEYLDLQRQLQNKPKNNGLGPVLPRPKP